MRNDERTSERPRVLVDFVFEDGLLFIALRNTGRRAGHRVSVAFEPSFCGVGGRKQTSSLPLFRDLAYLAPEKTITTFLDTSAAYFARGEPTRIRARLRYQDSDEHRYEETIEHNLEIYREIGYIVRPRPE